MGDLTYQSLMLIARTTSYGLTTIELGKELRQDQKMIFYYVKTLLEMKLVSVSLTSSRFSFSGSLTDSTLLSPFSPLAPKHLL
jgi:hypothetical protein